MMKTRMRLAILLLATSVLLALFATPAFGRGGPENHDRIIAQTLPGQPAWESFDMKASGTSQTADNTNVLNWILFAMAGWLGGMLLLFLFGIFLSRLTLKAMAPERIGIRGEPDKVERFVRAFYRVLIALTSIYFYISIPFLILLVIGLAFAILYLFNQLGRIPGQAVVGFGGVVMYTIYAIVRSIFSFVRNQEPGRPLGRTEAPELWQVTEEVAKKLNTAPIESIYIAPGTEIAVMERGSLLKKMMGNSNRTLILGIGVLPDLKMGPFKAILAHEYGHFRGKDTAGGLMARQVEVSIYNMALGLARKRQATWFNPAWLFVNGFYRVYLRITHGASRLQEILADRHAVFAYGADNVINGLTHMVRSSILFDYKVNDEVQQAISARRKLQNVYALPDPGQDETAEKIEETVRKAMEREASEYDTHPSPAARFQLIEHFPAGGETGPEDDRPAVHLLPNIRQLEAEMMEVILKNVNRQLRLAQTR